MAVVRNGPPEAVRITRFTPRAAAPGRYPAGMHWKIALCSLSMGMSSVFALRTSSMRSRPDMTSASLLASSTRLPARAAASVGISPAAPTMAAITMSTLSPATSAASASVPLSTRVAEPVLRSAARASSAARGSTSTTQSGLNSIACCTTACQLPWAHSTAARKRSGCRAMTARVLLPMLPVEPRMATPRGPLTR